MRVIGSRRGVVLVDVIITLFLLAIVGAVFSATFPAAITASRQARDYKIATAIAQRKMEQLRAMNYESLTQPHLSSAGAIDPDDVTSPYSFTSVESVGGQLAGGTGEATVEDETSDIKRVQVTVKWEGPAGAGTREVELTTLFADRRTRKLN